MGGKESNKLVVNATQQKFAKSLQRVSFDSKVLTKGFRCQSLTERMEPSDLVTLSC